LVGYAILGEDPSFDWQVLPEYEWSGIETEAIAWAETRLAELRQGDARRWGHHFVSGARQDTRDGSRSWSNTAFGAAASFPK
jgi:hypothetical protein